MMHAAAHRDGKCADVMLVTPAEFRRMEQDRASVLRILKLADVLVTGCAECRHAGELIREAVRGPS